MKKIFIFISLVIACSFIQAQEKNKNVVTITFKVKGNCDQCKQRIENSADIKGVKFAEWDEKAQALKVIYKADKVTEQEIKQAVLKSGHDVEDQKAPATTYDKLPSCCKYRDKKCDK